ncbi:helix-turn-helix domain-containing protein [Vibrio maerlii]|uniref:helix-turn-helix domain-containing protein n=1 Tax=Vibrio maerlii TaxID=2231648 RepID=UPI000E3DFF4A|nr:helix-turn-helix domain-containing protein [Vibrio maerlii]
MIPMIHLFYVEGLVNELQGTREEKLKLYQEAFCPTPANEEDKYVSFLSLERLLSIAHECYGYVELLGAIKRSSQKHILPKISKTSAHHARSIDAMIFEAIESSKPYISGFKLGMKTLFTKPRFVFDVIHSFGQKYPLSEVYFVVLALELLGSKMMANSNVVCHFKAESCEAAHCALWEMYQGNISLRFSQNETGIELDDGLVVQDRVEMVEMRSFTRSLEVVMTSLVADFDVTLQVASSMTSIPSRTIQRRLKNESSSFVQARASILTSRARELVRQGFSITDVAAELHFSSVGHFSRFIKNLHGQTPKQLFIR